jgi:hypothetical protein
MSNESPTRHSDEIEWKAESLRVTAFPSPGSAPVEPINWWERAVGEPPENRVSQPKVAVTQEQGRFFTGVLTLISQPGRIDWLLTGPDKAEVVGPFEESVKTFVPLIMRWFEDAPTVQRIAFGAVLRLPVNDRTDGYKKLSRYLHHVRLDPEGSTEFLFQINRPRNSRSGIETLLINRLSKWSVAFTQQATYMVQSPEAAQFQLTNLQKDSYCRLELDINTAPDIQGDLPANDLGKILNELVELGREIATKGDIS